MGELVSLNVTQEHDGARIDSFVASATEFSRSFAQSLADDGKITVDGRNVKKNYRLSCGETVCFELPEPEPDDAKPQDIPLDIVYEDDSLLVVNKPQGMVVHPANGNPDGTLVNALLFHCAGRLSTINGVVRPGIVHRIDKDTAGLLIVAKTDEAHRGLAEQIAVHSFVRRYEAVVDGNIKDDTFVLDFPIGRSEKDRKKMAVTTKNSRNALTRGRVLERFDGYTHVELTLETGRTHQIRVHMAHIGHPVTGDSVYGRKTNPFGLTGQCLFARYIGFRHPVTGEFMEFSGELPDFFINTLQKLRRSK